MGVPRTEAPSSLAGGKALRPGAYIYHCAGEGMPWEHVSYGMYGLIMVEPKGGLPVSKALHLFQRATALTALSPLHVLERGYAIASVDGRVLMDPAGVEPGTEVDLRLARGRLRTTAR